MDEKNLLSNINAVIKDNPVHTHTHICTRTHAHVHIENVMSGKMSFQVAVNDREESRNRDHSFMPDEKISPYDKTVSYRISSEVKPSSWCCATLGDLFHPCIISLQFLQRQAKQAAQFININSCICCSNICISL